MVAGKVTVTGAVAMMVSSKVSALAKVFRQQTNAAGRDCASRGAWFQSEKS